MIGGVLDLGELVKRAIKYLVEGALVALADLGVAGQRNDEQITLPTGEFQVSNVAGMNDVEAAVALNNDLSVAAGQLNNRQQFVQIDNFSL